MWASSITFKISRFLNQSEWYISRKSSLFRKISGLYGHIKTSVLWKFQTNLNTFITDQVYECEPSFLDITSHFSCETGLCEVYCRQTNQFLFCNLIMTKKIVSVYLSSHLKPSQSQPGYLPRHPEDLVLGLLAVSSSWTMLQSFPLFEFFHTPFLQAEKYLVPWPDVIHNLAGGLSSYSCMFLGSALQFVPEALNLMTVWFFDIIQFVLSCQIVIDSLRGFVYPLG